jgi:hypothetical protein
VLANFRRLSENDEAGRQKRVLVRPSATAEEWLTVSRRHVAQLRARLGLPRRIGRDPREPTPARS